MYALLACDVGETFICPDKLLCDDLLPDSGDSTPGCSSSLNP
jgi:hypothetical protein